MLEPRATSDKTLRMIRMHVLTYICLIFSGRAKGNAATTDMRLLLFAADVSLLHVALWLFIASRKKADCPAESRIGGGRSPRRTAA